MAKSSSKKNIQNLFGDVPPISSTVSSAKTERTSEKVNEKIEEKPAAIENVPTTAEPDVKQPAEREKKPNKPVSARKTNKSTPKSVDLDLEANTDVRSVLLNKRPKKELRNNKMGILLSDTAKKNLHALAESSGLSPNGLLNYLLEHIYELLGEEGKN